jgi:hypothetical protein
VHVGLGAEPGDERLTERDVVVDHKNATELHKRTVA